MVQADLVKKAMKMAESTMRPNIRIEIQNNLVESMDVDEQEKGDEEEEGEINDVEETPTFTQKQQIIRPVPTQRIWPNANGGFTTGINIFDKEEQVKLIERAKRFDLNPNDLKIFTDEQLQELHDSLGITTEEEKDVRFEAIHMRGTDEMSTEHVLEYFGKYGPAGIEWINDESCNVVWNDKVSAARALFYLSKPVRGMPVEGPCDPFVKELEVSEAENKENEGRSILLKNSNREVELQEDPKEDSVGDVHISDITVPIPPGYWRLGVQYIKSKFILLRFAFKSDKKPVRAEKFSDYYKKHGNPNFGGMKGLITETRKQKFKGIFDRNRDIQKDKKLVDNPKNPWGDLAMNWNEDAQYCEKEVASVPNVNSLKNKLNSDKSGIMSRLGFKRSLEAEGGDKQEEVNIEKKTKIPRMRMYADEEEEKIKRKRQLQALKIDKSAPKDQNIEDLRDILKVPSRKNQIKIEIDDDNRKNEVDLGSKLRNRNRRLNNDRSDSDRYRPREDLDKYKNREDTDTYRIREDPEKYRNREAPESIEKEKHIRRHRESRHRKVEEREDKKRHRRTKSPDHYHRRLHSDRHESHINEYEDGLINHKPRSKIAVVIKTQKKPTVASTVWSRINAERERLKTVSEGKLRVRRDSTSSAESESSSSESSSSTSSESSGSEEESDEMRYFNPPSVKAEKSDRPGFKGDLKSKLAFNPREHRSPLRIEISNDHFKKE